MEIAAVNSVFAAVKVTALYMAVPNCAVPFRHAILGGLFVAVTFTAAKTLFTAAISNSSYALVYGAFAAVPIFLLWLYISWTIILLGAIVVHGQASYQTAAQAGRPILLKALDVLYLLIDQRLDFDQFDVMQISAEYVVALKGLGNEVISHK